MKARKFLALVMASAIIFTGCAPTAKNPSTSYTDLLFDTVINVQVYDSVDDSVMDGCEKLCKEYDALLSKSNEDSDIYKINHSNGEPVTVSEDTLFILKKGLEYSKLTEGAFDITVGTITDLWDFKSEEHVIPEKDTIENALTHVGYENLEIKDNQVALKDPDCEVDVGAIAKGFIADKLKEYFIEQGVEHALINLGGNVLALGNKPDGTDFNIAIQKPFDRNGDSATVVKINDKTVVTTGNYQRYFEENGVIYHHVLESKTGFPCNNGLNSVTIITDSSTDADALSTSCFLLGLEDGMKLVNSLDSVEALFITEDDKLIYSDNFSY